MQEILTMKFHRWIPHTKALVFSLICVWTNGWVNNRYAGDLRRYRAHYAVTVMPYAYFTVYTTNKHFPPSTFAFNTCAQSYVAGSYKVVNILLNVVLHFRIFLYLDILMMWWFFYYKEKFKFFTKILSQIRSKQFSSVQYYILHSQCRTYILYVYKWMSYVKGERRS